MEPEDATIAIIIDDGYETLELWYPKLRLEEAGCTVDVVAPDGVTHESAHGHEARPDLVTENLRADDYDAVILPGGLHSANRLREDDPATEFVAAMADAGKPVAAVGKAGWILSSAGVLEGRTIADLGALTDDLINAGAEQGEDPVTEDDGLITAPGIEDLPAFMGAALSALRDA